jgi:PIN domain nuclease of toxin-antitoxin system
LRLLLDTRLLIWAAAGAPQLSSAARTLLDDPGNMLFFSAASLWEIAIKTGLGREDFRVDPGRLHRGLLENGYAALPITVAHAVAVNSLPRLHKDPFDRLLLAQAGVENLTLATADVALAHYPGAITVV